MSWTIILVLIIVGLLFLVLEILVIPGTTVVGVAGFAMIFIGIWQSYVIHGTTTGHLVLTGTIVSTVVTLVLSLRSRTWKKVMLDSSIDSRVNEIEVDSIKVGDVGKAISRIVPMGKALINDKYFEVTSTGELIDQETEIKVVKIDGNKIFVKTNN
ncbi:MAG: hypothetical protein IH598_15610 [Bacteroidales bacterium]|nr:hypothetical protein [Bacteroidales bacterium]